MLNIIKNRINKNIVTKPFCADIGAISSDIESLGKELEGIIHEKFGRSLHIREVDTASCGLCESEIAATTNAIYDIQSFGIDFVASPRHADMLLVTGPVSKNMVLALQRTYNAMAAPKFVVTVGDCSRACGIFSDSYYTAGGVDNIIPVSFHIPGCPPKPLDIIKQLLLCIKK